MAKERSGDTQEQIDKCLTCTEFKCTNCYENRKRSKHNGAYARVNERDFMEAYQSGYSDRSIALELGVSRSAVYQFRKRKGLAANWGGRNECKTN